MLAHALLSDYLNLTSLSSQVLASQSRSSLLLWYTADEPDGTSDLFSGAQSASERIYELDYGYHPVSLVLNCFDWYFDKYTAGTDIILEDAYAVDINATWSLEYNTEVSDAHLDQRLVS